MPRETKEKIILVLFLIFSIITVTILFKQPYPQQTSSIILTEEVREQFNTNERITGLVKIQLQEEDLLPRNTKIEFLISSNKPNCSEEYICPATGTVEWHQYNEETEECELTNQDPEGQCCRINSANCIQIVLNSGFEKLRQDIGSLPNDWILNTSGLGENTELTYSDVVEYDDGTSSTVAITDSSMLEQTGYVAIVQKFTGARKIKIEELLASTCADSDNGQNYTVKGTCTDAFGSYNDSSTNSSFLNEYYCDNKVCKNVSYNCKDLGSHYISSNGKCTEGCYDTDGDNPNVTGSCTNATAGYIDYCNGDNLTVNERYCSVNACRLKTYNCANYNKTCSEGRCVEIGGGGGGWPTAFGDADNGLNPNNKGTCTDIIGNYTDYCMDNLNLIEYVYDNSTESCTSQVYPCPLGCGAGACSQQTFPSVLSITGFSTQQPQIHKSLNYSFSFDPNDQSTCAFEVAIKSESGKTLHYYYPLGGDCATPSNDASNFYMRMNIPNMQDENGNILMVTESADLYKNWTNAGFSKNETIAEIWLISRGKFVSENKGQEIKWDDVKITKAGSISQECTDRGKKCCSSGSGIGNYYEQFSCTDEKECWSSCTSSTTWTLDQFVSNSKTPSKHNITDGIYQYMKNDEIYELGGDGGEGYTSCSGDTGNCRDWENEYDVNLTKANLKAPNTNGSYDFIIRLSYTPEDEECYTDDDGNAIKACNIDEQSFSFNVGRQTTCTENWQCVGWQQCSAAGQTQSRTCSDLNNCGTTSRKPATSRQCCVENWQYQDWSECIGRIRTREGADLNNCSTTFLLNDSWEDPSCEISIPCIELDYQCTNWSGACTNGMQTRNCELKADASCDETHINTRKPQETRECPEKPWTEKISLSILIPVVVVLVIIAAFLIFRFASQKTKTQIKPEGTYPELVSYIEDALGTGATKQEIVAKLLEAGWPRDAIDEAFKAS